jgi:hypothetical protein
MDTARDGARSMTITMLHAPSDDDATAIAEEAECLLQWVAPGAARKLQFQVVKE